MPREKPGTWSGEAWALAITLSNRGWCCRCRDGRGLPVLWRERACPASTSTLSFSPWPVRWRSKQESFGMSGEEKEQRRWGGVRAGRRRRGPACPALIGRQSWVFSSLPQRWYGPWRWRKPCYGGATTGTIHWGSEGTFESLSWGIPRRSLDLDLHQVPCTW